MPSTNLAPLGDLVLLIVLRQRGPQIVGANRCGTPGQPRVLRLPELAVVQVARSPQRHGLLGLASLSLKIIRR